MTSEGSHECIYLQPDPNNDTRNEIIRKIQKNLDALRLLGNNLHKHKEYLSRIISEIDEEIMKIHEKIDQSCSIISTFESSMQTPEGQQNRILLNLKVYECISPSDIGRALASWEVPPYTYLEITIPQFSKCQYFNILDNLSFPIIKTKSNTMVQYEICSDFSHPLKLNENEATANQYYQGRIDDIDVTVKRYVYDDITLKQLRDSLVFRDPAVFLIVNDYYRKNNNLHIITEPWKYTLWNEICSRYESKDHFAIDSIIYLFKRLIEHFKNVSDLLYITPNIFHFTAERYWKIWYPQSVDKLVGKTQLLYSSYEVGNFNEKTVIEDYSLCNLYSIGLVILQMASLCDTSNMYKKEHEELLKNTIMMVDYKPIRLALIGILVNNQKNRLDYSKTLDILEKTWGNL